MRNKFHHQEFYFANALDKPTNTDTGQPARMKVRWSKTTLSLLWVLLATITAQMPGAYADDPDFKNNDLIQEVFSTPETDAAAWEVLYSAYACVCHHKWVMADTYLMEAIKQGAADQMLQSRSDLAYLCKGLNKIAQKRMHASVSETTCQAQVLRALLIVYSNCAIAL